ncbi:MAG: methyltetrahydrofolate cobalamin methyltransferase [Firmicutes bacterium]|nr:methyltetrahydrofolate cobalamin methyltransferase [Bacillota bacterium]
MLIVGELINSSRKSIQPALESRDEQFIRQLARRQVHAGASYVDVNAGTFVDAEPEILSWLVEVVQGETGAPCSIDSSNPRAIEAALAVHRGRAMVNSVTLEDSRYEGIVPLVVRYGCKIVGLCMDGSGIPATAAERVRAARTLVERLTADGVPSGDIYLDPLVQPLATGTGNGVVVLETIGLVTREMGLQCICGLSNVSYGLPARKLINRAFLVLAMGAGLGAAIVDPLDRQLMALIRASEALLDRDPSCRAFLAAFRRGELEP